MDVQVVFALLIYVQGQHISSYDSAGLFNETKIRLLIIWTASSLLPWRLKQSRTWSDSSCKAVWSGSTLYAY